MKFFVVLLLSFVAQLAAAQDINYIKTYHPSINKAELLVVNTNYKEALENYEKAFAAVPRGFMKDYFNAAVCATYLGDATNTYKYLLEVASKGISLDFIKDETAFIGIQQDPNWRTFELEYLAKKREFDQKINKGLKDKLAKIVERDQWFRMRDAQAFADTIVKIDRQNATELDYIIDRYGFPNEETIGCGEGGMPIIQYPFYTVIRRQTPENQTINFSNYLMVAARNGKISPHSATYIMATINGNDAFFARHVFKILTDELLAMQDKPFASKLNKWVFRQIDKVDEQRINELRLQNGMESLADYRKKILFSLNDNRFLFPYRSYVGIWSVNDANIAADYLEGTVVLE
ncbi:hypothetical protein EMA8858_03187 [Emticicia aquatica]|jgi:hypothetical protein|uniref:Tetratricopeptide repeat protein n=1 Tax=Emticicia aquatica TaxID=1681835 RepID=A0ABN8EY06_9BACT|nr:hypothetical protein [Emticicia aquatica]CAH0997050.1 hypothetical protein EMA8858_03187 [Emticicia aquatica]